MASVKTAIIFALICSTYVHAGITASSNEVQESSREKRALLEIPIIGTALMIASKLSSCITSLLEIKFTALSIIFSIPMWIYHNLFSVVIGTVIVLGLKYVKGIFTEAPVPVYEMETLIRAARSLDNGYRKYGMSI